MKTAKGGFLEMKEKEEKVIHSKGVIEKKKALYCSQQHKYYKLQEYGEILSKW